VVLRIPLFPLETVVLLPDVVLPLHVFEPRYRQLTADVLAGDRRLGMIAVRPEHAHQMAGDPPLYAVGCAGFVTEHRRLPDGRYHLLLQGTQRFRVLREVPREGERLYRVAEAEPLPEPSGDAAHAAALRDRVIDLLVRLTERTLEPGQAIDVERLRALELARFANAVTQSVSLPTREKQSLLEAASCEQRLERLASALDFHLAWAGRPGAEGSETLH
jgi:Lon protease-like protein